MQAHDHSHSVLESFLPHGFCYLWNPQLLWTHVISDLLIGFAYVAISFSLAVLVWKGRNEFPFQKMFLAFGLFIIACGATHFVEVWTLWRPDYWFSAGVKAVTAVASVGTALLLPPLVPVVIRTAREAKLSETRRVQAESAERFRTMAEAMPQIVWTAEPDGSVDYYNRGWFEFTGITMEAGHGWGWQSVVHSDDVPVTLAAWQRAIDTGGTYEVQHRVRDAGGEYRWLLTRGTPMRDEAGQVIKWYGSTTDIDRQKRSEEEIRRAHSHLELLYETTRALLASDEPRSFMGHVFQSLARELDLALYLSYLVEHDASGPRLRLDSYGGIEASRLHDHEWLQTGDAVCGLVARQGRRIVVEDVQASTDPATARIRSLGVTAYVSLPLIAQERVIGTLSLGARGRTHFADDELELLQALAEQVAVAIERAQARQAERDARAAAEEASRAKSQFLAVMSHELRTPLNAVLGYEDLLEAEVVGPLNPVQKQHLGRIKLGAEQLLDLINQILSLSRIEAGKEEVRLENFDLAELVGSTIALMEPVAAKKGLELGFAADVSPLTADTDPGKVRQILLNLLSNAIKFTEQGRVRVTLQRQDDDAVCRVEDTGIGLREEDVGRVFEPFFQVDGSATRRQDGSGLGLPVSRELARLLGGDITVESEPGRGSVFAVRFPLRLLGPRVFVGRISEDAPTGEGTSLST